MRSKKQQRSKKQRQCDRLMAYLKEDIVNLPITSGDAADMYGKSLGPAAWFKHGNIVTYHMGSGLFQFSGWTNPDPVTNCGYLDRRFNEELIDILFKHLVDRATSRRLFEMTDEARQRREKQAIDFVSTIYSLGED